MVSGLDLDPLKKFRKDPCGVCQKGVAMQSPVVAICTGYTRKKSNGIKGPLRPNPDFRCARCLCTVRPTNGRTVKGV